MIYKKKILYRFLFCSVRGGGRGFNKEAQNSSATSYNLMLMKVGGLHLPILSHPVFRVVDHDEVRYETLLCPPEVPGFTLLRSEHGMVVQRVIHYRMTCRKINLFLIYQP